MRIAVRPVFIGVPVLLALALAAILAPIWMSGAGGGASFTEKAALTGWVEITVMGPDGVIKFHQIMANSPTSDFREAAADRLKDPNFTAQVATTYDNIQLCDTAAADPCLNTQLVKNLSTQLDAGTTNNPSQGTVTDDSGSFGVYVVDALFFCNSPTTDCKQILELQLTAGSAVGDTADIDIGAVQSVSVTLGDNDSLAITWTITIS